jgi:hypothetical protein
MANPQKKGRPRKKISTLPTKALDARQAKGVRGGAHKHLGGVKFSAMSHGTGMSKKIQ